MKHTKSMIYTPSTEATELYIVASNNSKLYAERITPIIKMLRKKAEKGIYNPETAVDAYYPIATEASNRYFKDYGYKFTVTERYTAAVDLEECFRDEVFEELNNN